VGLDVLKPDDAALFRVTLSNSISYYPAGPSVKKRIDWMVRVVL
jgi:hypothetical protein